VAAPRTELDALLGRDELGRPGVYILTGSDPTTNGPRAYIGEAEIVRDRLKQHKTNRNLELAGTKAAAALNGAFIRALAGC
jgi:hypothetical protein